MFTESRTQPSKDVRVLSAGEEYLHAALSRTEAHMGSMVNFVFKGHDEEMNEHLMFAGLMKTMMIKLKEVYGDVFELKKRDKAEGIWENKDITEHPAPKIQ